MILRDNEGCKKQMQDKIKSLYSEFLSTDEKYAFNYIDWVIEKLVINRKHMIEGDLRSKLKTLNPITSANVAEEQKLKGEIKKVIHKNYPNSLVKGDIININYGIGLGDELSDDHYGVIISRLGTMFLVAPLTKTPQPFGENNLTFKGLGLPGEDSTKTSYISFANIRYVHKRRIENIIGISNGRKHIDGKIVDDIMEKYNNIIKANQEE